MARALATVLVMTAALFLGGVGTAMATAPSIAIARPLTGSSTNQQAPPFAGTSNDTTDPITLKIYAGASVEPGVEPVQTVTMIMPTEVAVEDASWEATPADLAAGQYTAIVEQANSSLETGTSAAATFTIDTTPPGVSIEPPPSPTADSTPTLSGSAGTAAGDEGVTVVIYYASSSTVAAEGAAFVREGSWWYIPPRPLVNGTYTVRASQLDEAGNVGVSDTDTFTVDAPLPPVTLTTPQNGKALTVSRPRFGGRAGGSSVDQPLVTLKIYEGASVSGNPVQELAVKPSGTEWTTGSKGPALRDGLYTAVAEQSDDAGNIGKDSATFTIETSSPEVTLDTFGFLSGAGRPLTGPTPSFSGRGASDPEDGKSVIVNVYSGTSTSSASSMLVRTVEVPLVGPVWASGPMQALPDGTYTVQAEQRDSNPFAPEPGVSKATIFTVDADPPQVTLTSPLDGSSTSNSSQTVSGSAGTAEGDLPAITIRLFAGSTATGQPPIEAITLQASGASWSTVFGGLSPGTYTAQAEQGDDVGNSAHSEPATFTVIAPEAPVAPPSPPPSSPLASFKSIPSTPRVGEAVTLVSTSTDGSVPITHFAWAPGGNGAFTEGESSFTTAFATAGAHSVQLRVIDADGHSSVVAETITVSAAAMPLMQPFPVVRMAGSFNGTGAKINLLSVLAPVGATVTITCRGARCPTKSEGFIATAPTKGKAGTALVTFRRFERWLRAGVILQIWVSKHGEIGKFTRFTIHRGKSPSRIDECLSPAGTTPIVCPS